MKRQHKMSTIRRLVALTMLSALLFSNTAVYADTAREEEPSRQEVVNETGNSDGLSSTTSSNSSNNLNDTFSGTDITEENNSNTTTEDVNTSERTVSLELSNEDSSDSFDLAAMMLSESKVNKSSNQKTEDEKKKEEEEKKAHQEDCNKGNHTWEKQDQLHTFQWRDGVHYHEEVYKCKYCSKVKYDNREECTFDGDYEFDPAFENQYVNGKYVHTMSRTCTVCHEQKDTIFAECSSKTLSYKSNGADRHEASGVCDVCKNEFHFTEKCNFVSVAGNEKLQYCDKDGCMNFVDCREAKPQIQVEASLVSGGKGTYDQEHDSTIFDDQMQIKITATIEALNDEKLDNVSSALWATLCVTSNKNTEYIKLAPASFSNGVAVFNWKSEQTYSNVVNITGVSVEYSLEEKLKDGSSSDKKRTGENKAALNYVLRNVSEECAVSGFSSKVSGGNKWVLKENDITKKWYSKKVNGEDLTITYKGKTTSPVKDSATIVELDANGKALATSYKANVKTDVHWEIVGYWFFVPIFDIVYENTITGVVPADKDGEHSYRVNFDVNGHAYHSEDIRTFIDNEAPTYTNAKFSIEPTNKKYYNKDVVISVDAQDKHLDTNKSVIKASNEENKGFVRYSADGQTGTLEMTATAEGVHTVTGVIYDLAGNYTEIKDQKEFIIDKTAPKLMDVKYSSDVDRLNGKYYRDNVTVSAQFKDTYLSTQSFIQVNDANKAVLKEGEDTVKLTVSSEGEHTVTGKIYDLAGNCTEIKDQDEFIIDKTAPKLKITFDNHSYKNEKYYNADRTATFVLTDKYIDSKEAKMGFVSLSEKEGKAKVNEMSGADGKYTGSIEFARDGIYSIGKITFVDKAGNEYQLAEDSDKDYNAEFVIDKTAPTLKVTFDNHDVKHEKYYKADRAASFAFEDRNIDSKEANMSFVKLNEKEGKATVHEMTGSNGKYTGSVVFDKDGIYSIGDISFEDKAGNKFVFGEGHESQYNAEFVIDKTAPEVEVDFDNNNALNGNYYKDARRAEITFTERNFTADQVTVTKSSGDFNAVPNLKGYTSKELQNITHIDFDQDGRYGFVVTCEDLAGNKSQPVETEYFVIDMTLPELEISGVTDMSANNGTVAPVIVSKDENLTDACTEISLTGSNRGKVSPEVSRAAGTGMFTYNLADFAREKSNDDLYTLSVKLTDLAGNSVEKTVKYSLNRFGSVFVLDDATKAMVDGYYVTKPQDVVITEINVDSLTKKEVSVAFDGSVKELREGIAFTTSDSTNSNGWHSISYKVGKANFNKDGIYSVTVFSEDRATNKQSNQSKDTEIEFLLDKTAPSVIVSGLEDGGIYEEESHDFSINAADTIGVTDMKVSLNGSKLASYTADELNENGGTVVLTIPTMDDYQKVEIQCTDVAGNVTNLEYNNILVSVRAEELLLEDNLTPTAKLDDSRVGQSLIKNMPVVLGTGVALIIIAIISVLGITVYKKKKN